jgi:hypothetical protein
MTEHQLIGLWTRARWHIIVSQFAPTFLLTLTTALLVIGLDETKPSVRIAAAGILLASGVLGAVTQIAACNEGIAVIRDLSELGALGQSSAVSKRIVASARWINVVRIGTPAVFVVVYMALLVALFLPAS